jgi:hypothetical protein
MTLGCEHMQSLPDAGLTAEAAPVLELRRELARREPTTLFRLLGDHVDDHVTLALPLGIVLRADVLPHQPLVIAVQLDPFAGDLVDQLRRQRRPVPELDLKIASRSLRNSAASIARHSELPVTASLA